MGYVGPNNETERPGDYRFTKGRESEHRKAGKNRIRTVHFISRTACDFSGDAFCFEASLARASKGIFSKRERATNFREAKRVRETIRHHLYARVSPRASLLSTAELVNFEIWRGIIYPCTPDAILHKNSQLDHGQILYLSPFTNNN